MALALLGLVAFGNPGFAEDPEREGRIKVQFPTLPDQAPPGQQLSSSLQEALEGSVVDDLQGIVVLCANACEPKSSSGSSAPVGSKVKDVVRDPFSCVDGKCSCIGARNCVQMVSKDKQCRKKTVECTGAGCTCTRQSKRQAR